VVSLFLAAVVATLGLIGGGVLGAWQGLSENATNLVTAAAAGGVPVTSVHCSGLSPAYPPAAATPRGRSHLLGQGCGQHGDHGGAGHLAHRHVHDRRQPGGDGHHLLDTAAAYDTQYYYEVFSGAAGWVSAADVGMALSLPRPEAR